MPYCRGDNLSWMIKFSIFCTYAVQKLAQLGKKIAQVRLSRLPLFACLSWPLPLLSHYISTIFGVVGSLPVDLFRYITILPFHHFSGSWLSTILPVDLSPIPITQHITHHFRHHITHYISQSSPGVTNLKRGHAMSCKDIINGCGKVLGFMFACYG